MRGRMSDAPPYAKPVGIGEVMEGGTISDVLTSNVSGFAKGDIVVGRAGWQTHALSDGSGLQKVDPTRAPISTALGVLGMPGMTAYVGLFEIGKPAAGETVVVAAASGARIVVRRARDQPGAQARQEISSVGPPGALATLLFPHTFSESPGSPVRPRRRL